jgi:biopolymer transport protein ExbB
MRLRPWSGCRAALLGALVIVSMFTGAVAVTQHVSSNVAVAAPEPAAEEETADEGPKKESFLAWLLRSLGWRYTIAFLAISFSFVAVIVMNLLSARRSAVVPVHLVEAFEAHLNEKRYQEAYELAKSDDSFLGLMLAAGMAKLSAGYDQAMASMQQVGEDESLKIEHRLSYIALIGSISPMVGLLGTVDGMVASFIVIAQSPTTPKASELADGISTALVTTLVGLVLAIPAIMAFNLLKNRFARLTFDAGTIAEGLMSRFDTAKK